MLSLWDTSYLHHQFGGRYEQFFQPVNCKCLHLDDSQSLCMKAPAPLLPHYTPSEVLAVCTCLPWFARHFTETEYGYNFKFCSG